MEQLPVSSQPLLLAMRPLTSCTEEMSILSEGERTHELQLSEELEPGGVLNQSRGRKSLITRRQSQSNTGAGILFLIPLNLTNLFVYSVNKDAKEHFRTILCS